MSKVKTLIASAALTALAATAFAAPATAAPGKGTIGLVNGAPGSARVDLCIGGKEIRSKAKYGARTYRILSPGNKVIKVFKADPRKCKGKLLGKKTIPLTAGDDFTIVFTRKLPKFTVFSNPRADVPAAPGDPILLAVFYWRHAADLGNAAFKYQVALPSTPTGPSVDPIWTKGDQVSSPQPSGASAKLRATRPNKSWVFAQSPWVDMEASKRYEWILLGDKPSNAKFIVWIRPIVEK
jgi:hypothetical protein